MNSGLAQINLGTLYSATIFNFYSLISLFFSPSLYSSLLFFSISSINNTSLFFFLSRYILDVLLLLEHRCIRISQTLCKSIWLHKILYHRFDYFPATLIIKKIPDAHPYPCWLCNSDVPAIAINLSRITDLGDLCRGGASSRPFYHFDFGRFQIFSSVYFGYGKI